MSNRIGDLIAKIADKIAKKQPTATKIEMLHRQIRQIENKMCADMTKVQSITVSAPTTFATQTTWLPPGATTVPMPRWYINHPGIKTRRLYLLEFDGTEEFIRETIGFDVLQQIVDWLNDKELMKYSEQRHQDHNVVSQIEYLLKTFDYRQAIKDRHYPEYWFIFQCDDEGSQKCNTLIGTVSTYPYMNGVDIGILLGKLQGHGYATEALSAIINWHHQRGINYFHIGTDARNEAMINLAKTCGLKWQGCVNGIVYMDMHLEPVSKRQEQPVLPERGEDYDSPMTGGSGF